MIESAIASPLSLGESAAWTSVLCRGTRRRTALEKAIVRRLRRRETSPRQPARQLILHDRRHNPISPSVGSSQPTLAAELAIAQPFDPSATCRRPASVAIIPVAIILRIRRRGPCRRSSSRSGNGNHQDGVALGDERDLLTWVANAVARARPWKFKLIFRRDRRSRLTCFTFHRSIMIRKIMLTAPAPSSRREPARRSARPARAAPKSWRPPRRPGAAHSRG